MPPKEKFPISHVLIDCENVGLNGLLDLIVNTDGVPIKFVLFHNASNKLNIPLDLLKDLGSALNEGRLESVPLSIPENMTKKQAENALDFYIAFYMGQEIPHDQFNHCVILSQDRDYDPLILHVLKEFGANRCERLESYEAVAKRLGVTLKKEEPPKPAVSAKKEPPKPAPKAEPKPKEAKQTAFDLNKAVTKAKKLLKGMNKNPPTTMTKLQHSLKSWFSAEKITDANVQHLIQELREAKVLTVAPDGKKISY